jgi:hypothetical protein
MVRPKPENKGNATMKKLLLAAVAVLALSAPAFAGTCTTFHTAWGDMTKCDNGTTGWSSNTPYGTSSTYTSPNGQTQRCWTTAPSPYYGGQTTQCR